MNQKSGIRNEKVKRNGEITSRNYYYKLAISIRQEFCSLSKYGYF